MIQQFMLGYLLERTENVCPRRNLYMGFPDSITHNSHKVEAAYLSISWWMNKQNWFIHTREWSCDKILEHGWRLQYYAKKPVPKATNYMIPHKFIWKSQNRQVSGEKRIWALSFWLGWWKCSEITEWG
jgi:hypothetical protein